MDVYLYPIELTFNLLINFRYFPKLNPLNKSEVINSPQGYLFKKE